jgi:hypothetical protein
MASSKRKRSYTRQQVLDLVINDSGSENNDIAYDSDMLNDDSDSDYSESTVSLRSQTPQSVVQTEESGKYFRFFL